MSGAVEESSSKRQQLDSGDRTGDRIFTRGPRAKLPAWFHQR